MFPVYLLGLHAISKTVQFMFLAYIPFTETEVMAINKAKDKLTGRGESQSPKSIEIKDTMSLHLKISLISPLLSLKTAGSVRICCATYVHSLGDAAAGCCAYSRHQGQDGNKPQLRTWSCPAAPNKPGNRYGHRRHFLPKE